MHPTTSIRSESERELLDLHFHRRPVPEFQDTAGDLKQEKSKDKGKRPIQRRIAKGKSPDHQARRRSRKETHPFPKWRNTKGRELLASTKKTQWMRTAKKVQQRKPVPPMRKNRPEQKIPKKQRQLLKQVPTRKPARKGKGERGQRGLHLLPGITAHWKTTPIQQSETERNEVSDPLEHKVSITQDIPLSRERTGEGLT